MLVLRQRWRRVVAETDDRDVFQTINSGGGCIRGVEGNVEYLRTPVLWTEDAPVGWKGGIETVQRLPRRG